MAVRRNHEHSHHCKTSRLSLPSPLSLSLALPRVSSRLISLRKYPWRPASACTSLPQAGSLAIAGERSKGSPVESKIAESVEGWLRGLDSNQDIQLQRLACYRLHHPGITANTELHHATASSFQYMGKLASEKKRFWRRGIVQLAHKVPALAGIGGRSDIDPVRD